MRFIKLFGPFKPLVIVTTVIVLTIGYQFSFAFEASEVGNVSMPKWTISALNGYVSHHDGPNCFNAALAAKGILDEIVYSDSSEYLFYIENFCDESISNKNNSGNLIAFEATEDGKVSLMHGALNLNEFQMLEKNGSTGLANLFSRHPDPIKIINKRDSKYVSGNMADGVSNIKVFECKDVGYIRKSLSEMAAHNQTLKEINLAIAEISIIIKSLDVNALKIFSSNIQLIVGNINASEGKSVSDLYSLVRAVSLSIQMAHTLRELDPNYTNKIDPGLGLLRTELKKSIDSLIVKLEANLPDFKSQRIIFESKRHY
jgi:hypothetical protein